MSKKEDKIKKNKEEIGIDAEVNKPIEENDNVYNSIIKMCDISYTEACDTIKEYLESENPKVELREKNGEVHIIISAVSTDNNIARKIGKPVYKEIKSRFGAKIYTTDENVNLEDVVVGLLKENDLTITTAESCTGGMIAARLVDVPGVSDVFKEGFITYSNKAKRLRLAVKKSTLVKYGAVSSETAKEMAKGVAFLTKADVSVVVTGIAGPDGATEDKPVGLVYIGCMVCGRVKVREFRFDGDRKSVREQTVTAALAMLRMSVLEYYSEKTFS